jgi:hypothetical protein
MTTEHWLLLGVRNRVRHATRAPLTHKKPTPAWIAPAGLEDAEVAAEDLQECIRRGLVAPEEAGNLLAALYAPNSPPKLSAFIEMSSDARYAGIYAAWKARRAALRRAVRVAEAESILSHWRGVAARASTPEKAAEAAAAIDLWEQRAAAAATA